MKPTRELIAHDLAVVASFTDSLDDGALTVIEVYKDEIRRIFNNREIANFWEDLETEMQTWHGGWDITKGIAYLQDIMDLYMSSEITEEDIEEYRDNRITMRDLERRIYDRAHSEQQ